jgi:hypothetical protein
MEVLGLLKYFELLFTFILSRTGKTKIITVLREQG